MITSVLQYMCVQKLCPNSYERQKLKFTFSHWITNTPRLHQWYGEYLISLNKIAWNLLFCSTRYQRSLVNHSPTHFFSSQLKAMLSILLICVCATQIADGCSSYWTRERMRIRYQVQVTNQLLALETLSGQVLFQFRGNVSQTVICVKGKVPALGAFSIKVGVKCF